MKWFSQYLPLIGWPYSERRSWQHGRVIPAFTHSGRHWLRGISTQVTMYAPFMPVPSFDWVHAEVASDC